MSKDTEKWLGAALGFGAGIVWVAAGAGAALVCMLGAALCAGAVIAREAGLVGWVAATATGVRKRVEARIPAERPARTIGRKQAAPNSKATQPKTTQPKAAQAKPTARPEPTAQPKRRPEAPVEAPLPAAKPKKPYDHDEPSSEHVYEVATYGW